MALSNYDLLCFDELGHSTNGILVVEGTVQVAAYKNWLYVSDPNAWREGTFAKPVIMRVDQGQVTYRRLRIRAWRYGRSQNAMAFVVETGFDFAGSIRPYHFMAGIAKYGFVGQRWDGILPEDLTRLEQFLAEDHYSTKALRVLGEHRDHLLRVNQGDMCLSGNLGTKPGEAQEPVLLRGHVKAKKGS